MTGHTLLRLFRELAARRPATVEENVEELQAGLLLALVQASYSTLDKRVVPTPLYRFRLDESNLKLVFEELGGEACVPKAGALSVCALDLILTATLREYPLLFEGPTGVGKTYLSMSFLRACFAPDQVVSMRLSAGVFGGNVFQPFLKGQLEGGLPRILIDHQAVDRIAGILCDEVNRGDPQTILQLLDGELHNGGQVASLGIRIPQVDFAKGRLVLGDARKMIIILAAMNPAHSDDPRYAGTIEIDAAVDNRFIRIPFGKPLASAGASVLLAEERGAIHEDFLAAFTGAVRELLGVSREALQELRRDYLDIYAFVTQKGFTSKTMLGTAAELADLAIVMLGGDLPGRYRRETAALHAWAADLPLPAKMTFKVAEALGESHNVKTIQEVADSFRVEVIPRDAIQLKKLADLMATLASLKGAFASPAPLDAYLATRSFLTPRHIACAALLLARGKQAPGAAPAPAKVIEETLAQYAHLQEAVLGPGFRVDDPGRHSIKRGLLLRALERAKGKSGRMVSEVAREARGLIKHCSKSNEVRTLIAVRLAADLMTLAGFIHHNAALAEQSQAQPATDGQLLDRLARVFYARKRTLGIAFPGVFQHRVPRILDDPDAASWAA